MLSDQEVASSDQLATLYDQSTRISLPEDYKTKLCDQIYLYVTESIYYPLGKGRTKSVTASDSFTNANKKSHERMNNQNKKESPKAPLIIPSP